MNVADGHFVVEVANDVAFVIGENDCGRNEHERLEFVVLFFGFADGIALEDDAFVFLFRGCFVGFFFGILRCFGFLITVFIFARVIRQGLFFCFLRS